MSVHPGIRGVQVHRPPKREVSSLGAGTEGYVKASGSTTLLAISWYAVRAWCGRPWWRQAKMRILQGRRHVESAAREEARGAGTDGRARVRASGVGEGWGREAKGDGECMELDAEAEVEEGGDEVERREAMRWRRRWEEAVAVGRRWRRREKARRGKGKRRRVEGMEGEARREWMESSWSGSVGGGSGESAATANMGEGFFELGKDEWR